MLMLLLLLSYIMGSLCGLFLVCSDPLQLIQDQDALFSRDGRDDAKSATNDPDGDTGFRVRRRFTSSPKTLSKVAMMTPSLTPISLFLFPGLIPSISDREHNNTNTPSMTDFSRILSTSQLSQLYQSLPAGSRIQPWSLLYSLSTDGCSLQTLYSKIIFDNCNLLLILQVFILYRAQCYNLTHVCPGHAPDSVRSLHFLPRPDARGPGLLR